MWEATTGALPALGRMVAAAFPWDAATWIAFAAFVISAATFYLSLLRPADIEIYHAERTTRFLPSGRIIASVYQELELSMSVYASNLGAHGGLLTSVQVTGAANEGTTVSSPGSPAPMFATATPGTSLSFPLTVQPGDFRSLRLRCTLRPAYDVADPESNAQALRGFEGVAVQVAWQYVRTTGLPLHWRRLPRRLRRHRATRWRTDVLYVDGGTYRSTLIGEWRRMNATAHLADIAEGTAAE